MNSEPKTNCFEVLLVGGPQGGEIILRITLTDLGEANRAFRWLHGAELNDKLAPQYTALTHFDAAGERSVLKKEGFEKS